MKSICLNMIVKDESRVILRCLASVKELIDYWVIVDTGSTDQTKEIIREFLKEIPGELIERPWVHFAHNRNEVLQLAKDKADYHLFIDADDELVYSPKFKLPSLNLDCYLILFSHGGCDSHRVLLTSNSREWRWEGVVHETLNCVEKNSAACLENVTYIAHNNGARSTDGSNKYLKDAQVLERALLEEPQNGHYLFQLALAYEAAEQYEIALKTFHQRVDFGGFDLEVYHSLYRIGAIEEKIGENPERFLESYWRAYQYRKSRAEPLFALINFYVKTRQFDLGYSLAKLALTLPIPTSIDSFWTERMVYEYGLLYLFAHCSYFLGKSEETYQTFLKLLKVPSLPKDLQGSIQESLSRLEHWRDSQSHAGVINDLMS